MARSAHNPTNFTIVRLFGFSESSCSSSLYRCSLGSVARAFETREWSLTYRSRRRRTERLSVQRCRASKSSSRLARTRREIRDRRREPLLPSARPSRQRTNRGSLRPVRRRAATVNRHATWRFRPNRRSNHRPAYRGTRPPASPSPRRRHRRHRACVGSLSGRSLLTATCSLLSLVRSPTTTVRTTAVPVSRRSSRSHRYHRGHETSG